MITYEDAKQIAEAHIKGMKTTGNLDIVLHLKNTIEKPYAWIFFYNLRSYVETGDRNSLLVGNAPLFISKSDGIISSYRTGLGLQQMMDAYEEDHKIWELILVENIYSDAKKMKSLKLILNLAISDLKTYKQYGRLSIDSGSETRLKQLQTDLMSRKIETALNQKLPF